MPLCPSSCALLLERRNQLVCRCKTGDRKRWPPVSLISKVGVVELLNLPTGGIVHYYSKSGPDAVGEHIVVCFRNFSLYNHITRSVVRDHYNLNIF